MNKSLVLILCAMLAGQVSIASAQTATSQSGTVAKKPVPGKTMKKKTSKAAGAATAAGAAAAAASAADDDEREPDLAGSTATEYDCELGNKVTIYTNAADDKHIAMRWKKRLMRMTRVDTTTGAQRFENQRLGMVWLGIPAKGILLDSKKGQQLANECRTAEQRAPAPTVTDTPTLNQLLPQT